MGENTYNLTGKSCPACPDWPRLRKRCCFAPGLPEERKKQLGDVDALLSRAEPVKVSNSTTAGVASVGSEKFFIKRSNVPSWRDRFRRLGRLSRAERNELFSRRIAALGIRVPAVWMSVSTSSWGMPGPSYLVTEYFPGVMNAADNFGAMLAKAPPPVWIRRMTEIMARLHEAGIVHGDLKMVNFLALPGKGPDGFELGLFDFDGTSATHGACPRRVRRRELARAVSSFYDFLPRAGKGGEYSLAAVTALWCRDYHAAGAPDFSGVFL